MTCRVVEIILTVILGVGGGLLLFGAHFCLNMVHDQLAAQAIVFPAATAAPDATHRPQRYCWTGM